MCCFHRFLLFCFAQYQINQEVESSDGDRSQQLAQSYWRKMVEIMKSALQSLKPRIRQVRKM
jgi:hypothetical protein